MKYQTYVSLVVLVSTFTVSQMAVAADPADSKVILQCASSGFALASIQIVEKSDASGAILVRVSEEDDASTAEYEIKSGLKDIKNGTSATLTAQEESGEYFGGAYSNALLLRIFDSQKSGIMAMSSNVYKLICSDSK